MPDADRGEFWRGLLVAGAASSGWMVLWCIAGAIGLKAASWVLEVDEIDGYGALSGIVGACAITPLAFVSGFFLLLARGRVVRFLLSGALVGLAITAWPLLLWPLRLFVPKVPQ